MNKGPYISLLRDGSAEIRGVSIEAGYLFNKCPQCGKRFDSEEESRLHMDQEHFVKVGPKEVHGIVGQALSLVLAPEEQDVPDMTVELFETAPGFNQLIECVLEEREFKLKKESRLGVTKTKKLGEPCPYASFDARVAANQDNEDPEAYCASIMKCNGTN